MDGSGAGGSVHRLLLHSAKQVVQVVANGETVLRGKDQNTLAILNGTEQEGISIVIDRSLYFIIFVSSPLIPYYSPVRYCQS